ncbi:hypothetical protein GUJ93_ZPchr0001g31555 [Zizania palustris]|uniref:Uncharacterized protein n=1 Tax=Zizania palustris TaxID=103762 RepID=A0A8J5RNT1_ZIZPA|nr:hypothetical protein GUJ93_ZPchr0001g31555 [Zizania palustris]
MLQPTTCCLPPAAPAACRSVPRARGILLHDVASPSPSPSPHQSARGARHRLRILDQSASMLPRRPRAIREVPSHRRSPSRRPRTPSSRAASAADLTAVKD